MTRRPGRSSWETSAQSTTPPPHEPSSVRRIITNIVTMPMTMSVMMVVLRLVTS